MIGIYLYFKFYHPGGDGSRFAKFEKLINSMILEPVRKLFVKEKHCRNTTTNFLKS